MRDTPTKFMRDGWGPHFHIHSHQLKCKDPKYGSEGPHPSLINLVRVSLIGVSPFIEYGTQILMCNNVFLRPIHSIASRKIKRIILN